VALLLTEVVVVDINLVASSLKSLSSSSSHQGTGTQYCIKQKQFLQKLLGKETHATACADSNASSLLESVEILN